MEKFTARARAPPVEIDCVDCHGTIRRKAAPRDHQDCGAGRTGRTSRCASGLLGIAPVSTGAMEKLFQRSMPKRTKEGRDVQTMEQHHAPANRCIKRRHHFARSDEVKMSVVASQSPATLTRPSLAPRQSSMT